MNVTALGYAASLRNLRRQHIPLDDRDSAIEIRYHSGGEKTAHARPENDRTLTEFRHVYLLPGG